MRCLSLFAAALVLAPTLAAQQQQSAAVKSPQVNADGSITLRYRNASATKVDVTTDASLTTLPMTKGDDGVWSVTTAALPPEYYSYTFLVDGIGQLDPLNHNTVPNLLFTSSSVLVPGATPRPWELSALPHGVTSHHYLPTHIGLNLPQGEEPYVVYTPPNYDAQRKGGYPVLYLLHGYSDSEVGWTDVGHADRIMDSLIAAGKAVPMIVVMPQGYGNFQFVMGGFGAWNHPERVDENVQLYDGMLTNEIIPAIEREYNVAKGRDNRAIAGLSMGGLESLSIGLHHTDQFGWVGGFSSAVQGKAFDAKFPGLTADKAKLHLLWVGVGENEELLQPNRDFITWARGRGFAVTAVEIPGKHTWLVWRDNLLQFAPRLFKADHRR